MWHLDLRILRLGRQARYRAQARRGWFSFRQIQRGHGHLVFEGDLDLRTTRLWFYGRCHRRRRRRRLLGPGFYGRRGARAEFLSTQSTKVTSRTDGKTDDLSLLIFNNADESEFRSDPLTWPNPTRRWLISLWNSVGSHDCRLSLRTAQRADWLELRKIE